jgi:hypothetical protein
MPVREHTSRGVQLELSSTMTGANAEEYDLQCISTMRENVYVDVE